MIFPALPIVREPDAQPTSGAPTRQYRLLRRVERKSNLTTSAGIFVSEYNFEFQCRFHCLLFPSVLLCCRFYFECVFVFFGLASMFASATN